MLAGFKLEIAKMRAEVDEFEDDYASCCGSSGHFPFFARILRFGGSLRDFFQPDFPPPGMDAARAKHPLAAITRFAIDALQHHSRRAQMVHLAGLLVDEFVHPGFDAIDLAAIGHELRVETEAAIGVGVSKVARISW